MRITRSDERFSLPDRFSTYQGTIAIRSMRFIAPNTKSYMEQSRKMKRNTYSTENMTTAASSSSSSSIASSMEGIEPKTKTTVEMRIVTSTTLEMKPAQALCSGFSSVLWIANPKRPQKTPRYGSPPPSIMALPSA